MEEEEKGERDKMGQKSRIKLRSEDDVKKRQAMSLVPALCKEIAEFAASKTLSDSFFENLDIALSGLMSCEPYHFNMFLFELAFNPEHERFAARARKSLKDALADESFCPDDFMSDAVFAKLMELLQSDDPVAVRLAYELVCRVFDVSETRDKLSKDVYMALFAYVRDNLDKAGIIASMCTRPKLLDASLIAEMFPLIIVLIQGKPKELPEIGLLILVELLEDGIEVDQAFLSKCIEPFCTRLDSEISSCVMKIMMNLQEAPHSFLPRLLQIMYCDVQNEYYGETEIEIQRCCGTSALCLLKKFANQDAWDDEEKKQIIYTLVSLLDSFTYRNIKSALQILIKIMDPLPTDVRFFKKLAQVIGEKDFTYVGLDAILQILQKCELRGIDPEMIEILHDLEPELEQLQLAGNRDIADLSRLVCRYM